MTDAETPPEASIEERFRIIHDHPDLVDQTLDELAGELETELEERNDSYVIEIPSRELHQGDLQHGETYKVALISTLTAKNELGQPQDDPKPPVQMGDVRVVEIEAIGQQGDGIAKVERGYVIIVPNTEVGDEVTIDITNVSENFAHGTVTSANQADTK